MARSLNQGELPSVQWMLPDARRGTYLLGSTMPMTPRTFGGRGDGPGQLAGPDGIAVDSAGRWYVSDVSNHRIDVFGGDGTSLGSIPLGFTQMAEAPAGIAIGGDGTIWVADSHVSIVLHLPRPAFVPA